MIAPGHLIVAPDGDDGASEGSGTSFASPHAAAVAALLAGRCLSPDEIIDVMTRSGTVVSNGCSVDDSKVAIPSYRSEVKSVPSIVFSVLVGYLCSADDTDEL
jgi:subtilisin family serine protease